MNMLPINSEWKRRIKWAEKQRKKQPSLDKASRPGAEKVRRNKRGK